MAVIFNGYRQYGGLELSSGCWGDRGFMYESVVGGLEEVEDSKGSCLEREKGKGERCLSKISNMTAALVIAAYSEPSTNPRRCACRRRCL